MAHSIKRSRHSTTDVPLARPTLPLAVWLKAAAIVVLVVVVYLPTLDAGFIWDDDMYVEENPTLRSPSGLADIWFKLGAVPQYYPLVHTSYWLEYQLWGTQPIGYHVVNLSLHALSALLIWRLLARLAVPGAWLARRCSRSIQSVSRAWLGSRSARTCSPARWHWARSWPTCASSPPEAAAEVQPSADIAAPARGRWLFYALALLLYVLALWSKTVTATVPAVLLVIYWWKRGITRRDVAMLSPFFATGLAMGLMTVWMERTFIGASGPEWDLTPIDRILVAGRALWFYAGKLFWPQPLIFFYPRWTIDSAVWWQYLYPAAAVAVIVALYVARRRIGRGPLAAVLIFAGVLTPALGFFNVYPFLFSFVADHFQYHASIALLALAAATLTLAVRRLGPLAPWVAAAATVAILTPLAFAARSRTAAYHDLNTLYEDTIAANPEAWAAHVNLGYKLQQEGEYARAIDHYRRALAINPNQDSTHIRLGMALFLSGQAAEGMAELDQALAGNLTDSERSIAHVQYGIMLTFQKQYDVAIEHLELALALRPQSVGALLNLGVALWERGDREAGIERLRQALAINPNSALGQDKLGTMLLESGQVAESLEHLRLAVGLQPFNTPFRVDLAKALIAADDLSSAEHQLRIVLDLTPTHVDAIYWLGVLFEQRGQRGPAIAAFKAALLLDPKHTPSADKLKQLEADSERPKN